MPRALIVGGTQGFGNAVERALRKAGYETVTVGRSKQSDSDKHFICDVGIEKDWRKILSEIRSAYDSFDVFAFLVGFARAKPAAMLVRDDWDLHDRLNVAYVREGLDQLEKLLLAVSESTLITIGSQWSYRTDNDFLKPYIKSKHELRALTASYAKTHPSVHALHYVVPPMDTPQRGEVWSEFGENPEAENMGVEVVKPAIVADAMAHHALRGPKSDTYIIDSKGEVASLTQGL